MRYPLAVLLIVGIMVCGCRNASEGTVGQQQETSKSNEMIPLIPKSLDLQGHRGCRGLLPENTITGFLQALDHDVVTLEMDVVVTADKKVLLSHEPWFSHEICLDPQGLEIAEVAEREHRIFAMSYEQTQLYDCGSKPHPRFPGQINAAATKPLLSQVIAAAERHATESGRELPFYNIETKCLPAGDGWMHPEPDQFVDLLVDVLIQKGVTNRCTIQSFDVRTLQYLEGKYPELRLALLIENGWPAEENLENLGFVPDIYSPDYQLVNEELVAFCKDKGMKLIPWTVNEIEEMKALVDLGVDGIISDYPDRFSTLYP